ncbi:hypothetical protein C8A00DRAFT_38995 [Chaetomidium leptoderma]|uniref:BZIP domain-containing protein n=1 Tax=Chaetomidium leptoderma TaxID=669021 RepID=A0AAN6VCJ9_9PEZI|nr:hypothetical protein C8A00DRAFT_38995 [Chaetomidium leptoderma]
MARPQTEGFNDPLVDFIDFSAYDNSNNNLQYQQQTLSPTPSTSLSPQVSLKSETSSSGSSLFPTNQGFTGPSHQYDLYKQQTGLVPGALTTTLSMNQPQGYLQEFLDLQQTNMLVGLETDDMFDFNSPLQGTLDASHLDMDFQTPADDAGLYLNTTINPSTMGGQEPDALSSPMPSLSSHDGRVWPGIHQQQAALARAQQQQKQQQQQLQRQRARAQQAKQVQKSRSPQTSDSIAEQNVQHILNSMRSEPVQYTPIKSLPPAPKPKKPETEMDADEKFLASEEGKKLATRERRQLRNKVSARAFRYRRKEYILWLEGQLTERINDSGLLRAQNRALTEENARLTSLTKMLLSSQQFKDMLGDLSSNPQQLAQFQTTPQQQPQPAHLAPLPQQMSQEQRSQHFQQQFQQHQACFAA